MTHSCTSLTSRIYIIKYRHLLPSLSRLPHYYYQIEFEINGLWWNHICSNLWQSYDSKTCINTILRLLLIKCLVRYSKIIFFYSIQATKTLASMSVSYGFNVISIFNRRRSGGICYQRISCSCSFILQTRSWASLSEHNHLSDFKT